MHTKSATAVELEVCKSLSVEALGAEVLERGRVHGVAEVRQQELEDAHRRQTLTSGERMAPFPSLISLRLDLSQFEQRDAVRHSITTVSSPLGVQEPLE